MTRVRVFRSGESAALATDRLVHDPMRVLCKVSGKP